MKKLVLSAACLLALMGFSCLLGPLVAAEGTDKPHKVGVVDMSYVIDNYAKMKQFIDEQKADAEQAEDEGRAQLSKMKAVQAELKDLKEGSTDYSKKEAELAKLKANFDTFRAVKQREIDRRTLQMQQTVYLEAQDAIAKVAEHYGYTMVLQHLRNDAGASNPRKMQAVMGQTVVWHRKRDDMSEAVLELLNRRFEKSSGTVTPAAATGAKPSARKGAVKPASGSDE